MYKDIKSKKAKFWPREKDFSYKNLASSITSQLKITPQTKICSMGSCFGVEIKHFLRAKGYSYMLGEQNKPFWDHLAGIRDPRYHASVCWERIYNTFTFLNIIQYTFREKEFDRWLTTSDQRIMDLVRNYIFYPDMQTAQEDIIEHIAESRRILTTADLLIFTLGLTEVWRHLDRGFIIGGYNKFCASENLQFQVSQYQQNLNNLEQAYYILKKHNPKLQILITVSPIPLNATFRADADVITSNCNSKSILVAVANQFVRNHSKGQVYYFPSYEIATTILPMLYNRKPSKVPIWRHDDNRHLSKETVRLIMKTFRQICMVT